MANPMTQPRAQLVLGPDDLPGLNPLGKRGQFLRQLTLLPRGANVAEDSESGPTGLTQRGDDDPRQHHRQHARPGQPPALLGRFPQGS